MSITLEETALLLLALRWLWRLAHGRARPGWPLAWPLGAFAGATLLAALLSARPMESLFSARTVVLLASVWILRDAVPDARAAAGALSALLGLVGVVGLVGIAQVGFCGELAAWEPWLGRMAMKCHRARGFYSIYMTFGGVLAVVLLATLPLLSPLLAPPRWRPPAWLSGLVALALTYVRGAWLGFGAGVGVLAVLARRRRGALIVGLLVVAAGTLLLPGVRDRARSIGDRSDPTSSERVYMWRSGMAMARDHLLTGIGPGEVKRVYPRYAAAEVVNKGRGHLHCTPVQILVERGVLGLAAWLWLFAAFFARALSATRRLEASDDALAVAVVTGAIAAITGFLVAGLTEYNFGDTEVLLAATFVMSMALVTDLGVPPTIARKG